MKTLAQYLCLRSWMSENGAVVAEILKFAFVTPTHAEGHPQECAQFGVSKMTGQCNGSASYTFGGHLYPASKMICRSCKKWYKFLNTRDEMSCWQIKVIQCWWASLDDKKYIAPPQNRTNGPTPLTHVSKTYYPLHHSALLLLLLLAIHDKHCYFHIILYISHLLLMLLQGVALIIWDRHPLIRYFTHKLLHHSTHASTTRLCSPTGV